MNNKIQSIFERNPTVHELYTTADGQVFFKNNFAANHAQDLVRRGEKGDIVLVTRGDSAEAPVEPAAPVEKTDAAGKAKGRTGRKGAAPSATAPAPATEAAAPKQA